MTLLGRMFPWYDMNPVHDFAIASFFLLFGYQIAQFPSLRIITHLPIRMFLSRTTPP
jgi:hypothetical protein